MCRQEFFEFSRDIVTAKDRRKEKRKQKEKKCGSRWGAYKSWMPGQVPSVGPIWWGALGNQDWGGSLAKWYQPRASLWHLSIFLKAQWEPHGLTVERARFSSLFIHLDLHLTIRHIHLGSLWSIAKYTNTIPCVSHCFKHSHGSWLS